jgi:hypothetical protein
MSEWEKTANPVYVWEAIQLCTDANWPLPPWVSTYLAAVANRMLSHEARRSPDLRRVLPSILGFRGRAKRGPGRPLDPDAGTDDRMHFALRFAIEVCKGREPPHALTEACNVLDARCADKDIKTLWRWLKEEFGLTEMPRTNLEWRTAARDHYTPFFRLIEKKFRETVP